MDANQHTNFKSSTPFSSEQQQQQQQQSQMLRLKSSELLSCNGSPALEDDEISVSALNAFRDKEEEIKKKKMEVREKVYARIGRVEEETKRLAEIRQELEGLADPMGKEVSIVRKKIDLVNRELKPLGQICQKKEKEFREAVETFNEKNKEKAQLVTKLMELVAESERARMRKLEELSKNIELLGHVAPR